MYSTNVSPNATAESSHASNSTIKTLSISERIFISDHVFHIIHIAVAIVFAGFLSILGMVSNVINVIIHYQKGVKDSVTVSYIALSFWNGCLCLLTLFCVIFLTIDRMFPVPQIDFSAVLVVYISYARSVTHIMATLITVYLSTEFCICITIPLKVKLIFTKSRSVIIHITMLIFTIVCNCPAWATQELRWKFDPRFNRTRLGMWVPKERPAVEMFMAIFTGNVIQVTAQALSVVCAILLISGIKKSAKFRMQSVRKSNEPKESLTPKSSDSLPTVSAIVEIKQSSSRSKLVIKSYTKLAKITAVITILFVVFNIPVMAVSLSRTIVSDLTSNVNLISVLYIIVYVSTLMNSNTSIFVYYNGSEKFRTKFRALLCMRNRT